MYGYTDWELQPQMYLSVGTLFLLKLFSLPLLLPWLRCPIPQKQTLKNVMVFSTEEQRGAVYIKRLREF